MDTKSDMEKLDLLATVVNYLDERWDKRRDWARHHGDGIHLGDYWEAPSTVERRLLLPLIGHYSYGENSDMRYARDLLAHSSHWTDDESESARSALNEIVEILAERRTSFLEEVRQHSLTHDEARRFLDSQETD